MKVELGAGARYVRSGFDTGRANHTVSPAGSTGEAPAVTETITAAASGQRYDFTSMTRGEMRNWVNERIRSGQMSLDEGAPFMMMTMKIPVGGSQEIPVESDHQRINFIDKAEKGIAGALWRNDEHEARQLRAALDTMLRQQRQTTAVSIRA